MPSGGGSASGLSRISRSAHNGSRRPRRLVMPRLRPWSEPRPAAARHRAESAESTTAPWTAGSAVAPGYSGAQLMVESDTRCSHARKPSVAAVRAAALRSGCGPSHGPAPQLERVLLRARSRSLPAGARECPDRSSPEARPGSNSRSETVACRESRSEVGAERPSRRSSSISHALAWKPPTGSLARPRERQPRTFAVGERVGASCSHPATGPRRERATSQHR